MSERLSTDPTTPSIRHRDVIAFLWVCDADARRRQVAVRVAMEAGDARAVAECWREAEMQVSLALWYAREASGGVLTVAPRRPTMRDRLRAAWRAFWSPQGIGTSRGR